MQLFDDLESLRGACEGGTCLSIGVFDGVHRGHQLLIGKAVAGARERGVRSLVITFANHPLSLLAPPYAPPTLTGPVEKADAIAGCGVDLCAMIPFTREFAEIPAERFVRDVLGGLCRTRYLACGHDFHFGAAGAGDTTLLRRLGEELGFEVEVCPDLTEEGAPVKSMRLRGSLLAGELDEAERMMGRPYAVRGVVIAGDGRGRTIGYPTANLEIPADRLIPSNGVYAVRVDAEGQPTRGGMMNIGHRPTFKAETDARSIEVHVFDFDGELYDRPLKVTFLHKIRDEKKFESVEELVAQLGRDEKRCRRILGLSDSPPA